MKRAICAVLVALLPSATLGEMVTIPFGTTVFCELDQQVVSKKKLFSEGDIVRAHVWKDVWADGHLVIEAGTPVFTRISKLQKPRIAGRKGQLELEALNVTAVDRRDIPLEGGYDKSGKGKVGVTAALAAVVAWPLIFMKGKKAVLEPGTIFDAIVRSPVEVEVEGSAGEDTPTLHVPADLTVEVLYDDIDVEQKVRELPLRLESELGPISEGAVVSVNGEDIAPIPLRLTTELGEVVTAAVDFKALSKHFSKGMNRLGVQAGEATAEVLLEIEF